MCSRRLWPSSWKRRGWWRSEMCWKSCPHHISGTGLCRKTCGSAATDFIDSQRTKRRHACSCKPASSLMSFSASCLHTLCCSAIRKPETGQSGIGWDLWSLFSSSQSEQLSSHLCTQATTCFRPDLSNWWLAFIHWLYIFVAMARKEMSNK